MATIWESRPIAPQAVAACPFPETRAQSRLAAPPYPLEAK